MAVYPPINLSDAEIAAIVDSTQRIGQALHVRGLMNVQYVIMPDDSDSGSTVYVLEVNPRSSRTVPFISKVTGVPMVRLAINVMLGKSLAEQGYQGGLWPAQGLVAIKAPVFSMSKLIGVDTYLGPEMKSTGEVMGVDYTFPAALAKALSASDLMLPREATILVSIADRDKWEALPIVRQLGASAYKFHATEGTANMIRALDLPVEMVPKRLEEGHPNVEDVIREGLVQGVINTPAGGEASAMRDGFQIRRAAAEKRIPCFTSLDTARAAVDALLRGDQSYTVQPLREYLGDSR